MCKEGNKKEISILINALDNGGAENVCLNLANSFINEGLDVTLVVLYESDKSMSKYLDPRIKLINLSVSRARYAVFAIYKYLKEFEPVKLLVFNHQLLMIAITYKLLLRKNFNIYSRGINTLSKELNSNASFFNGKLMKNLIKLIYPRVDGVVCQSQGMKEDLIMLIPSLSGKVITINNPLNDRYKGIPVQNVDDNDYVLFVGRLEKQKNLQMAVEIFNSLLEKSPSLDFYIVGEGSEEVALKKLVYDLKLTDKVHFLGVINDPKQLASLYFNAKATILTSLFEGFPNVLVESISFGTPVVAFDCMSGPKDIILNKRNGYLININDSNEFKNKLLKTIETDWCRIDVANTIKHLDSKNVSKSYLSYMGLL